MAATETDRELRDDVRKAMRQLSTRFVVAVLAIAALVLAGQFVVGQALEEQLAQVGLSNLARKQRARLQLLPARLLQLQLAQTDEDRATSRRLLGDASRALSLGERLLDTGGPEDLLPPERSDEVRRVLGVLEAPVEAAAGLTLRIAEGTGEGLGEDELAARSRELQRLVVLGGDAFDRLVLACDQERAAPLQRLQRVDRTLDLLSLALLAALALLVFRPLWRRLEEEVEEILRVEALVGQQNDLLTQRNRELEQSRRQLEQLATRDGLTGLRNHRTFQEVLASEMQRALRAKRPLSLLLLDVDHFKRFNDSFGHPAGDEVLRRVASLAEKAVRQVDVVARYGGEEFVVVLPDADEAAARLAGERVREAIAAESWPQRAVTVSIGAATLSPRIEGREMLVALADRALYAAKHAGRNRFIHADDLPPEVPPVAPAGESSTTARPPTPAPLRPPAEA